MTPVEFPAMPLYWKEWLTGEATTVMTAEQEGAFLNLLMRAWGSKPACTLPDDDAVLAQLSKLGPKWKRGVGRFVRAQFELVDGRLRNQKQWEVYTDLLERHGKRSEAGKKGNAKRWEGSQDESQPPSQNGSQGDRKASRKRLANGSPAVAVAVAVAIEDTDDVDTSSGGEPPASYPQSDEDQYIHRRFMPLLRNLNYVADGTDGSILKILKAKHVSEPDIEGAVRGLASLRDRGELVNMLGVEKDEPLNMRMLYQKSTGRMPIWREAENEYFRIEEAKGVTGVGAQALSSIMQGLAKPEPL